MGRPSLVDQRHLAEQWAPDLLRRLDRLEHGDEEPEWVLIARREIAAEVLKELSEGLK